MSEPIVEDVVEVVGLRQLLRETDLHYYSVSNLFESWIEDPDVPTPKPYIKLNGEYHWQQTEENVNGFLEIYDTYLWLEAEQLNRALNEVTVTARGILDYLKISGTQTVRQNSRCYKNNRGNSISDGRQRVVEFKAQIDFVMELFEQMKVSMPKEDRQELTDLKNKAQSYVEG